LRIVADRGLARAIILEKDAVCGKDFPTLASVNNLAALYEAQGRCGERALMPNGHNLKGRTAA